MLNPFAKCPDFKEACLSKVDFNEQDQEKISTFIKTPKNILFVHSAPSIGKTYLCAALANMWFEKKYWVRYFSENDFFKQLKMTIHDGGCVEYEIGRIADADYFIFDDLGSYRNNQESSTGIGSEWSRDVLFNLLDSRVMSCKPTVITSNHSIKELKEYFHERFIARLEAFKNIIIELKGPDKRKQGY